MKQEQIGLNAGITWRTLSKENKKVTFDELTTLTALSPLELAAAIDWLSRENKILFSFENEEGYYAVYQECYY